MTQKPKSVYHCIMSLYRTAFFPPGRLPWISSFHDQYLLGKRFNPVLGGEYNINSCFRKIVYWLKMSFLRCLSLIRRVIFGIALRVLGTNRNPFIWRAFQKDAGKMKIQRGATKVAKWHCIIL